MASPSLDDKLQRAMEHVSTAWLPPHEEVLCKIQSRLASGVYDSAKGKLTEDLKEDFALYMYCLRELTEQVDEAKQEQEAIKRSPSEIFETADIEKFKTILDKSRSQISTHSLDEMSELQALRFRESMLSAATAEALSSSVDVNPETGFSCGLLRQLGLTLISWNYPRVYKRAVETLQENTSLDAGLKRTLGFTPTLLGLGFARKWNLSDDILSAMGEKKTIVSHSSGAFKAVTDSTLSSESAGATLAKICEVGEALARANNPEHYPSALSDWETAKEAIVNSLGPDGIQTIYDKTQERLTFYAARAPEVQGFAEAKDIKERIVDSQYAVRLLEKNHYLKSCPEEFQREIKALYQKFRPNKILKSNIEYLVKTIVPMTGFNTGALFMYEPEARALSPAVKIGEATQKKLRTVRIHSHLAQFDLIASAYSLKSPLREESIGDNGEPYTLYAGAIGTVTPIGVLYLECKPGESEFPGGDPMILFKVLRHCVGDCLNVS